MARRVIGVDESGKGDFFGPLVVAGFLCADSDLQKLKDLGVRDSKMISEGKLIELDRKLRAEYPHQIEITFPAEYNRQYKLIRNLNKLLAARHADAIENLLKQEPADLAISDKFGKSHLIEEELHRRRIDIPLTQLVRGEKIPQVAAASILARAAFLRAGSELAREYDVDLPRGAAAHVDAAGREIVKKHGIEILSRLAKLHFKNYQRVINPVLFV